MKTALVGGLILRLASLPIRRRRGDSNLALERLSKPYVNDAMWRSQSGVPLRDKGWRIEQVPVIDAYRTDRRVNTQPQPDGVGHVFESDVTYEREHIADVVKGH